MIKQLIPLFTLLLLAASASGQPEGATTPIVFASPGGGAAVLNGQSVSTTSLQSALQNAQPGTTIQLTPGTYSGAHVIQAHGRQGKPITIRGLGQDTIYDGKLQPTQTGYCLVVQDSAWINITNLHFRNCWPAAIAIADSAYLSLRALYAEGSRVMVYAKGLATHHLLVENSSWNQDPSGRVWRSIPWEESHHGKHRYFNGAMLYTNHILGSVVFRHNQIKNAFNGIQLVGDGDSAPAQNRNIEIYHNHFENIRDNPIEPENSAENLWIHHNSIKNAHALFSFTGVAGGNWYIFRNTGWFDERPGGPGHNSGKIFKFDRHGPFPSKPVQVFNNSWYSHSPLIAGGEPRNFKHWNNAIYFEGPKQVARNWHFNSESDYNLSNLELKLPSGDTPQYQHSVVNQGNFFVDRNRGDFRLSGDSPAIDRGKIIELFDWRSEYRGSAPDIGAFEGNDQPAGPPFRFDPSAYREYPRIVRADLRPVKLRLYFSTPLQAQAAVRVRLAAVGGATQVLSCTAESYQLTCPIAEPVSLNNIVEIALPKALSGSDGLPLTLWASPQQAFAFSLY